MGKYLDDVQHAFATVDKSAGITSTESALWNQARAMAAVADALDLLVPIIEKLVDPFDPNDLRDIPLEGSIRANISEALARGETITMKGGGGGGGVAYEGGTGAARFEGRNPVKSSDEEE